MTDAPYLAPGIWLAHLLVEIPRCFELPRNWSIQLRFIIDYSNRLRPYMEVLILSVLHVPPEKHPTENGVIAGRIK